MNKIKAYLRLMRLDKPVGIFLLLWPTLWSLWIAARGFPPPLILFVFIFGVVLMRSAGCVVNDIADRKLDIFVERTKKRPLATQEVKVSQAIILFFVLMFLAFLLVCTLNRFSILLSLVGGGLAAIYPFMKRFTHWPQLFLGAAFAWSVPMGFAAIQNQLPPITWLLFAAALVLPMAYDTQYAMVDREDDLKAGIKSTAIFFGRYDRWAIALFQLIFLALMFGVGVIEGLGEIYSIGLLVAAFLFIYQQQLMLGRERKACFKAFLNNQWVVLVIFVSVLISYGLNLAISAHI